MRETLLAGAGVLGILTGGVLLPAPVQAQGPSAGLEEIVVTARRREENIQSVPVAITALSQEVLKERRIESLDDLQRYVPSLTTYSTHRETSFFSIRGHGGFAPGATASVIAYLNEVPATASGPGLYYDLQNLQVLKGPQGTLFGRNTTGGALLFQTARPTNELGGYIQGSLGNYKNRELEAMLNVPIIADKLLLRLAGTRQTREGFTRILSTPSHPNGLDVDNRDHWAGRATVTFKPTENITNDLIYDYYWTHFNGTGFIFSALNPALFVPTLFPTTVQLLAQQRALGVRTAIGLNDDPFTKVRRAGITDVLNVEINEDLTFRNIFGYRSERFQRNADTDGTNQRIFELTNHLGALVTHQYTEEAQLQGTSFDQRLTWVVGGFYLKIPAEPFSSEDRFTFGRPVLFQQRVSERSLAIYGQGTYDLSSMLEGLKLTAGLRYTWDDRFTQSRSFTAGACSTPQADATCTLTGQGKFDAPTWTLGLDYQIAPDTLVYFATRRGYRSGGFNVQSRLIEQQRFQPEYVTDFEIGLKSDWRFGDATARTNVAGYLQKYNDIQLNNSVTQLGVPATITQNIAKATVMGMEFEGSLVPVEWLELTAAYSYGFPNFDRFDSGAAVSLIAGYHWTNFPRHKVNLGARVTLPIDESLGKLTFGANLHAQTRVKITIARDAIDTQDGYGVLNLSANWDGIAGLPVDLSLFMTNATNRVIKSGSFSLYTSLGMTTVPYAEPRMYGARLRYRFGAEE